MNAAPLEHFERWDIHKEGTQAAVRRVTDALDAERIAIREALGYGPPHFPLANHYAREGEEWMYGRGSHDKLTDSGDWREKIVLTEHRYMREDVRIGLSFLASVGELAGVATPLARRFPRHRLGHLRRGLRARPAARWRASASAISTGPDCRRCWPRASGERAPGHRLSRRRAAWRAASPWCSPMPAIRVAIVDVKARSDADFARVAARRHGRGAQHARHARLLRSVRARGRRRHRRARDGACGRPTRAARCAEAAVIFEGVPEVLDLKREVLARVSALAGPERHHRLDHVDHHGRRPVGRRRAARALPQRPLAQPGLSHPAGGAVAGRAHRPRRHRAAQGAAGGHRQGAGGVRGAAGLHRAAHPGAGHERGGAHGGGGRRLAPRTSTRPSSTASASATPSSACSSSSTTAAATSSTTPAAT